MDFELKRWPTPGALLASVAIALAAISALRLLGPGRDLVSTYLPAFAWARELSSLTALGEFPVRDPGFGLLLYGLGLVCRCPDGVFLFALGLVTVSLKLWCFRHYAPNLWIAIVAQLALFYVVHDYTQLRAGLAIALMMLAASQVLVHRRYVGGGALALGAAGVHLSSAILAPAIAGAAVSIYALLGLTLAAVVSGTALPLFENISPRVAGYVWGTNLGRFVQPNPVSSLKLLQYVTLALFLYYRDDIIARGWKMVEAAGWFLLIGLALFFGMSAVPVLANRLSELFTAFMPFLVSGLAVLMPRRWAIVYVVVCVIIGGWGSFRILN